MNKQDEYTQYKAAAIQGLLSGGTGGEIGKIVRFAESVADEATRYTHSTEEDPVVYLARKHGWNGKGTPLQFLDDKLGKTTALLSYYRKLFTAVNDLADARGDQYLKRKLKQLEEETTS